MTPALKTPETIARIRIGARTMTAAALGTELGWDIDRVMRTAKEYQIELTSGKQAVVVSIVEPEETSLDKVAAVLSDRQREVLRILRRSKGYLHGEDIAERMNPISQRVNVRQFIEHIAAALPGSGWSIDTSRGRYGGYRLMRDDK